METPVIIALVYLAIGAAIFAHPPAPATPNDFHWRRQFAVFRDNLLDVFVWPVALWQLLANR
jgi:hypothetical protein